MMNTQEVAQGFVHLVLKYRTWPNVKGLSQKENQIIFDTVVAAGFEPEEIVLRELRGSYRDQDGSSTGETYPINELSPFAVKSIENEREFNYRATQWLDKMFRRTLNGKGSYARAQEETLPERIEAIRLEIERSVPLELIQLTPEGDLLGEYPPSGSAEHTRDKDKMGSCVGVHKYCNGWVDRYRASVTHDVLCCRRCNLRVPFLREIQTFGELRQWFTTKLNNTTTV